LGLKASIPHKPSTNIYRMCKRPNQLHEVKISRTFIPSPFK